MSAHTDFNVPFIIGATIADRPASSSKDIVFIDVSTGLLSFYTAAAWHALLPSVTSVASMTALKALTATSRYNGLIVQVTADGSLWQFNSTSTATGDDLLVATPSAGSGRWTRLPGAVDIALPITSASTNNQVLLTLQAGQRLRVSDFYWETTVAWSGGSSSAIGLNSSKTGFSTAGDLLGGAAGDVAATLVTGVTAGTIGVGIDSVAKRHAAIFVSGDTVRFNRITSAFTTGAGNAHCIFDLLLNTG